MTLTPELIGQLTATYGPTVTVIIIGLVAYITRTKKAEPAENPVKELLAQMSDIRERVARIEGKMDAKDSK